ncbi:MAG: hypothetical protein KDK30_16125, partial [Leptospiraceae bacterium]|nr:hypothetical protein [Leptospiraceae bacterium]
MEAVLIEPGATLLDARGHTLSVQRVQRVELEQPEPIFNLEVEHNHNYFAGANAVLVHNGRCPTCDLDLNDIPNCPACRKVSSIPRNGTGKLPEQPTINPRWPRDLRLDKEIEIENGN